MGGGREGGSRVCISPPVHVYVLVKSVQVVHRVCFVYIRPYHVLYLKVVSDCMLL